MALLIGCSRSRLGLLGLFAGLIGAAVVSSWSFSSFSVAPKSLNFVHHEQ
jgi:hypothetical protein